MEAPHPLEAIVRQYKSRHKNLAMRVVHNHEDAEDVVQEAYLLAFRKFSQFQGRSSLASWVARIIINAAYMHVRRQPKVFFVSLDHKPMGVDATLGDMLDSGQLSAEQIFGERQIADQAHDVVCRTVASLTPSKQKLLQLRFEQEITCKQLAASLGLTFPATKARIHRTLSELRNQIKTDQG